MKPRGHKRGCRCIICARPTKKARKKRANHGYENQAATLHERALQEGAVTFKVKSGPKKKAGARARRKNSTVPIPGTVRARSMELRRVNPETVDEAAASLLNALEERVRTAPVVVRGNARKPAKRRKKAAKRRNAGGSWFILDLFDSKGGKIGSRYKQKAKADVTEEGKGLVNRKVGHKIVRRVVMSGPYASKPGATTVRR